MKTLAAILTTCVTMPIWYYIVYTLLCAAHVDRLVWFLFWIYIPIGMFAQIVYMVLAHKKP